MDLAETSPALQKALARIRGVVESGSSYEAQQMYKTAYHRHKAKRQLRESYIVLKEGAAVQLRHGEVTCGVELALLLLEAYADDKVMPDAHSLSAILDIISAFPAPPANADATASASGTAEDVRTSVVDECSRLVVTAVKWAERNKSSRAARQLHDAFAQHLWREYGWRFLSRAISHFIRGDDSKTFAQVLKSCSHQVLPEERDLLLTRAVLQVLAVASRSSRAQQLGHAKLLLDEAQRLNVSEETPLTHFVGMLLQALEKESVKLVQLLRDKYSFSLARDRSFTQYLNKIEQVYLNVGGGGGTGGLLGGLLKQLTEMDGGGDVEEYESADEEGEDDEY